MTRPVRSTRSHPDAEVAPPRGLRSKVHQALPNVGRKGGAPSLEAEVGDTQDDHEEPVQAGEDRGEQGPTPVHLTPRAEQPVMLLLKCLEIVRIYPEGP